MNAIKFRAQFQSISTIHYRKTEFPSPSSEFKAALDILRDPTASGNMMSVQRLYCPAPIKKRLTLATRDFSPRELAIAHFDRGEYLESIRSISRFTLTALDANFSFDLPMVFQQGPTQVSIAVENGEMQVSALIARLQESTNRVALLRLVLSRMAGTGQIFQPKMIGNDIYLMFRERLEHTHPLKLQEVLQKLSLEAANYDDWIVEEFSALQENSSAHAVALSEAELQAARSFWRQHWQDMEIWHTEVRRKRSGHMLDVLGAYACDLPQYILPLHGVLRVDLQDLANELRDQDEPISKRDAALARCIKDMQQRNDEQIGKALNHLQYAMNPLSEGSSTMLHRMIGGTERMQAVHEHRSAGRLMEASLDLAAYVAYMLAHNAWPEAIDVALQDALLCMHDKPLKDAVDLALMKTSAIAKSWGHDEFSKQRVASSEFGAGVIQ